MKDETALLRALIAGEPEAFAQAFETYADPIYRLALGLLRDESLAEDVVQDTFLTAIAKLKGFEGRSKLSTWLYRVAYNKSIDLVRKRVDAPLPEDDPELDLGSPPLPKVLVDWGMAPEEILADQEARGQLDRAIGSIPESLRAVFILRDIEQLSTAETAESVGISEGAVKVRLHRARLALRESLASYFAERLTAKG